MGLLRVYRQDRPGKPEFGYGPERVESGCGLMVIASTFGYAYELTGDEYYLEIAYQLLHEGMRFASELMPRARVPANHRAYHAGAARSDGKSFSVANFYTPRLPTVFCGVDAGRMDRIRKAEPTHRANRVR